MSVSVTLNLPEQPSSGLLQIKPLGGDGYTSPQSYYLLEINQVSGAGGGTNTILVNLDPQYQCVVALMQTNLASPAADRVVRLDIFPEGLFPEFSIQAVMAFDADVGSNLMYSPPPLFNQRRVSAITDAVDTETLALRLVIYNFKRDAFQKVPLNILLESLPRGFSIQ